MNKIGSDFPGLADRDFLDRMWDGEGQSALGRLLNIRLVDVGTESVTFEGIPSRVV